VRLVRSFELYIDVHRSRPCTMHELQANESATFATILGSCGIGTSRMSAYVLDELARESIRFS
jgi:hypothetical protein